MAVQPPLDLADRIARIAKSLGIETAVTGAYAMAAHRTCAPPTTSTDDRRIAQLVTGHAQLVDFALTGDAIACLGAARIRLDVDG